MHKGTNTTVDEGQTIFPVAHSLRGEGFDASEDGTGRGTPLVPVSVALRGRDGGATAELGDDCAFALRASSGGGDKPHVLAFAQNQRDEVRVMDVAGALAAEPGAKQQTYVAHAPAIAFDAYNHTISGDCAGTISTTGGPPLSGPGVLHAMQVRRLTPRECERLQGFPDDWTDIRPGGKPTPDGPRYKALGNSMAVPCMHWIGKRIQMVEDMVSIPEWLK